ncbi:MAG: GNAT family N-acetyltransferase [Candidatus Nanopelagicales bacterium]
MPALGRIFVTPADVGRKVSIRHLIAQIPTDALGALVAWQNGEFLVETKTQEIKKVPFKSVIAAKVISPEVSAAWVQTKALSVWKASETQNLGDWVLQATGGGTSRVNSCLLVGLPNKSIIESLSELIAWYQARNLTPLVHLSSPGLFDEELTQAGFEKTYLIDFLYKQVAPKAQKIDFIIERELQEDWLLTVNRNNGEKRRVDRFTLESGDWVRFLSLKDQGEIIATARIAGVADFALVTNLFVAETHRGKSIAQALMSAVESIAFDFGLKHIWLQVLSTNQAAQSLYKKINYQLHHQYQYWAYSPNRD